MGKVIVLLLTLLFGFSVQATANTTPQYEFGHYEYSATDKCHLSNSESGCTITLKKKYSQTPLVFLMPTIPANNPDADRPQTVSLLNVTKESFTIKQFAAPLDDDIDLNKEPMTVISYFVMEPGELTLDDGHKIYAGSIDTGKYAGHGKESDPNYENVNFNSYSLSASPVVLSEVQTRNNNRWFTSAVHSVTTAGLNLGLEVTRVRHDDLPKNKNLLSQKEKIAYLVSEPTFGLSGGYQYEFTKGSVLKTKGDKPLKSVCDGSNGFQQRYDSLPFVIGGKLERNGGQGGWLRRCELTDKGVSFVIDEDIPDGVGIGKRSHTSENIGFMAFAPKVNDYCEYFPSVAQSHYEGSTLIMMGDNGAHIRFKDDARPALGFKKYKYDNNIINRTCRNDNNQWMCELDSKLIVNPKELKSLPNSDLGNVTHSDKSNEYIVRPGNYNNIQVDNGSTIVFKTGKYTIKKLLSYNANIRVENSETKAEVYLKEAELSGKINVNGKPEQLYIFGLNKDSDPSGGDYIPSSIKINQDTEITAYIYSKGNVIFSATYNDLGSERKITLKGAVTARNLRLDSQSVIQGDGICLNPPPSENLILEITPTEHYSLTCDDLLVTFNVKTEDGELANDFNGTVTVSTDIKKTGLAYWSLPNDDSILSDAYTPTDVTIKNGQGRLRLHSPNYIGNIKVTGKAVDSTITNEVKGNYTFVPFKFGFTPSPIKTIAGKPTSVTISALACNDGTASVATGYSGNKELTINTTFIAPREIGNGKIEISKPNGNTWKTEQETLNFSSGVAKFDLKYPDAGKVNLSVSDPNCSLETGCDSELTSGTDDEYDGWELLKGSVEVHARPWTFAVCPKNKDGEYVKADGTSSSGEGFVAAGDKFDVDVKPIVWRNAGSETADINSLYSNSIDLCESVITSNFFKAGAPAARVELSIPSDHSITPVNGKPGELQGITVKEHTDTLTYTDLSWNEVGSVRLQAKPQAKYLGMNINQGYRDIGRFYPKYLELQPNRIIYPNGHDQFAYLGQPFNAQVMIKAKNALGNQVNNYNKFDLAYQADVALTAYEHPSLTSLHHRFSYHNATGSTEKTFKGYWNSDVQQTWLLARKPIVAAINPTTEEDGPWSLSNSRFGGYITESHDPISIRNSISVDTDAVDTHTVAQFEMTPNLRYGRMVLDDAISPFDQPVNIPLKVQHWDGSEFQTHIADSGSEYNSNYYCKQALHPNDESNISVLTMNKTGSVNAGKSDQIEAHPQLSTPANYKKQQTRFWLRIATDAPINIGCSQTNKAHQPWLTYNWRELGDEDPSAIVTFGVYRGSDRIVYRGEKGLN